MQKLIIFLTAFLFFVTLGFALGQEPKLKLKIFEGVRIQGIYFEIKEINPYILYEIQSSVDLIKWENMVRVGSHKTEMESPLFEWDTLSPNSCFFRIVER